ncbi:DnaJ-like subfamily C member 9 [Papilio machaon]|uniref:DnaJ-like subfamily C member 9 n=1 Tax=Papilio machaon TaxID=76193 RepID=A0A0N1I6Y0_PAPMA|nr:DnaJ-like subfamily C member 9 [Papilio machaon]
MGLLQLCEQYFSTANLYEVFQIPEKATEKEVKKAYHKLSLKIHPDRVSEDEKLEATEKFKVLGAVHAILSDKEKRAIYDETKCVDEDDLSFERDWSVYWRGLFKTVTVEDIIAYEKKYIGSQEEKDDLKSAYLNGKGDMDYILDQYQFDRLEHESRIKEILTEMIENEEIPTYKKFTNESNKKRQKRTAKIKKEAKEAEELKSELGLGSGNNSLEEMIKQRQQSRSIEMDSLIDDIAAKYSGKKTKATKRKTQSEAKGSKRKRKN